MTELTAILLCAGTAFIIWLAIYTQLLTHCASPITIQERRRLNVEQ